MLVSIMLAHFVLAQGSAMTAVASHVPVHESRALCTKGASHRTKLASSTSHEGFVLNRLL